MFFDYLVILQTIDRLERAGQTGDLTSGANLLSQVTGGDPVVDDRDIELFIRELEMCQRCGYLDFKVMGWGVEPASIQQLGARTYLAQTTEIHLLPPGRDLATSRVFAHERPDPGEDDGSPITQLTFSRVAEILAPQYTPERLALFLESGGVPAALIPDLSKPEQGLRELFALFDDLSPYRHIVRGFLGLWLSQGLPTGPNADEEKELLADLARQGWFVHDDRLVRGEPIRRATVAPLLGGDLLVNLHAAVQEAARPSFAVGNRAAAVFEAFKAIELRTRELLESTQIGMSLMGEAFDSDSPKLALNDRSDQEDVDEQRGFALIFKGAMQGIRNPKAHAPFEELDERRALDYLGLASLLMRRLDDAAFYLGSREGEEDDVPS